MQVQVAWLPWLARTLANRVVHAVAVHLDKVLHACNTCVVYLVPPELAHV
jgi:hypothetical protein